MTLTKLLRAAFATKPRPKARRRLGLEALESRWCPAGGQLDTTFNGTGMRTVPSAALSAAYDTAVQSDGKIINVGTVTVSNVNRGAIVRLNINGSMDTTFNNTGQFMLPAKVGTVSISNAYAVAVQPDGKIVVGAKAWKEGGSKVKPTYDHHYAVARFNANGSLDTTFGSGGWWIANPFAGSGTPGYELVSDELVSDLALLPNGSILVGGQGRESNGRTGFAAAKLTPVGALVTSFGAGGFAVVNVGNNNNLTTTSFGMAATTVGGAVLVGSASTSSGGRGCIVVFTPSGQLDATFNGSGVLVDHPGGMSFTASQYNSVAMQGNSILVGGSTFGGTTGSTVNGTRAVLARYTASGALDTTFATNGYYLKSDYPTRWSLFRDVAIAADGSILVAGHVQVKDSAGVFQFGLTVGRLTADGQEDVTYGSDGDGFTVVWNTGINSASFLSIAIGPDGKLVVGAWNGNSSTPQALVFRFTAP